MVRNQEWFDRNYPRERNKVDFGDLGYESFEGNLCIENYPELREIYLFRVNSIDKINLKNLTNSFFLCQGK